MGSKQDAMKLNEHSVYMLEGTEAAIVSKAIMFPVIGDFIPSHIIEF